MDFDYDDYFGDSTTASGYETLIYDCLCGDATLFNLEKSGARGH